MSLVLRLIFHLAEFFENPDQHVDDASRIQHLDTKRRQEDDELLDEFGSHYVAQLRRRITRGRRPTVPLINSRPQMLYFKDAVAKKKRRKTA